MAQASIETGFDDVDGKFIDSLKNRLLKCVRNTSNPYVVNPTDSESSQDFSENKTALVSPPPVPKPPVEHIDDDKYNFNYPKRGLAVIINNEKFITRDFSDRPGSSYDAVALHEAFKGLGFEVLDYDNLTGREMMTVLKYASVKYDHVRADCFACAVLSHGDQTWIDKEYARMRVKERQDLLFGVDGVSVPTRLVLEWFNDDNCPGLQGKPRLFFFQACRGSGLDDGTDVTMIKEKIQRSIKRHNTGDALDSGEPVPQGSSVDPPEYHLKDMHDALSGGGDFDEADSPWGLRELPTNPAPLYKDCLVMYATPPGHFAWRRKTGAWFVQSLCMILKNSGLGSVSLLKGLVLASKHVAINYHSDNPSNYKMHNKKEMPVIQSMLVKDIFMAPKFLTSTFNLQI
ncbi:caspase-3-like isoform X2 [Physella acuta]|uniref:caspase-3-like isoform X2 n=1 Tax=Physella acuta TaxID=109671 RepID=UPI0027DC6FBD|nr:caspase-3-like isoform X2 [Physella acuta]